ncbi:hypothetical protein COS70_00055, partial [Candidatus Micrarchaeota archaeon CG06_land_8_20_14_3_00_50_6]
FYPSANPSGKTRFNMFERPAPVAFPNGAGVGFAPRHNHAQNSLQKVMECIQFNLNELGQDEV